MPRHSDLFRKACQDTNTAWQKTGLALMARPEKVDRLRTCFRFGTAADIAALLMEMAWDPYNGGGGYVGIDSGKARKLSELLMTAILLPMTWQRDMQDVELLPERIKDALVYWIDTGFLPNHLKSQSDEIRRITDLMGGAPARIALSAPFAAPLEFAVLALREILPASDPSLREIG